MYQIKDDKGKRFIISMDDEYRINISENGINVMVENLSIEESCVLNIHTCEDNTIKETFDREEWNDFICTLIDVGYLS